jgi:hypothetical protein
MMKMTTMMMMMMMMKRRRRMIKSGIDANVWKVWLEVRKVRMTTTMIMIRVTAQIATFVCFCCSEP